MKMTRTCMSGSGAVMNAALAAVSGAANFVGHGNIAGLELGQGLGEDAILPMAAAASAVLTVASGVAAYPNRSSAEADGHEVSTDPESGAAAPDEVVVAAGAPEATAADALLGDGKEKRSFGGCKGAVPFMLVAGVSAAATAASSVFTFQNLDEMGFTGQGVSPATVLPATFAASTMAMMCCGYAWFKSPASSPAAGASVARGGNGAAGRRSISEEQKEAELFVAKRSCAIS